DSFGYQIGRHLGPRLRSTRLGRLVRASHWDRAETFLRRFGGRSVFLGRWVSFGRALVPALAGAARMVHHVPAVEHLGWPDLGHHRHRCRVLRGRLLATRREDLRPSRPAHRSEYGTDGAEKAMQKFMAHVGLGEAPNQE